jgi:hypothetical protein
LPTAVRIELSVVSAMAASSWRSASKRPISSAAKCWASPAEPPLPQARILPPLIRLAGHRFDGGGNRRRHHFDGIEFGVGAVFEVLGNAGNQVHFFSKGWGW